MHTLSSLTQNNNLFPPNEQKLQIINDNGWEAEPLWAALSRSERVNCGFPPEADSLWHSSCSEEFSMRQNMFDMKSSIGTNWPYQRAMAVNGEGS